MAFGAIGGDEVDLKGEANVVLSQHSAMATQFQYPFAIAEIENEFYNAVK